MFRLLCPIHSDRLEGFIPDDGVICDLGECLTKQDVLLFQILQLHHYMPEEVKSWTKLIKFVTGRLQSKIYTSAEIALKVNE